MSEELECWTDLDVDYGSLITADDMQILEWATSIPVDDVDYSALLAEDDE